MKTVTTRELWAAAYLLKNGVGLVRTLPGQWVGFVFDDADGSASRALERWRRDGAMQAFAESYREIRRLSHTAAA